jgi:hypothetical protein
MAKVNLALLDDRGVAGAQHVERQLARNLQRRLVDDFEIDGVHCSSSARNKCHDHGDKDNGRE